MRTDENGQLVLPKNIRQMGTFGDTYKVYVEDFVYTYVHQFLHQRKKDEAVLAAVLLGKTVMRDGQEYVFINGAQKVDFSSADAGEMLEKKTETETQTGPEEQNSDAVVRAQEFWNRVYRRIKESFDDCEILGWYFNLDGSDLGISADLQKFFETTCRKGSRFLYYEDSVEKEDAFFVQEQHRLQRLSGYAVYYEKNPQMQEFMIAERERTTPKPLRESYRKTERDEVVENYRAIMNKLNEKPARKRLQPAVYVAGAAVLAVVAAMGVSQMGNYQNLKVLEQTMQTLSKAVGGGEEDSAAESADDEKQQEAENTAASANGGADDSPGDTATGETDKDAGSAGEGTSGGGTTGAENSASAGETADGLSTEGNGNETGTEAAGTDAAVSADETQESENVQATASPSNYYIVRKGDSLASISRTLYGTMDKIQEICELNSIENKDVIYEGQKLLLP